jgi:hypothetical protein
MEISPRVTNDKILKENFVKQVNKQYFNTKPVEKVWK